MTEEEKIKEEIAFTNYWFTELGKTTTPTFADAIEWAEERQRKIDIDKACNEVEFILIGLGLDACITANEVKKLRQAMMED